MKKFIIVLIILAAIAFGFWKLNQSYFTLETKVESKHQILVQSIEKMGKLELVKDRMSDVIEHKNVTSYLPDASVLLIVKADAVGCMDLTKITDEDIVVQGDSATIYLPQPELCYVKIDHKDSKVYDTKMAFLREGQLVDEAYKYAEAEVKRRVEKSDIRKQTQQNAVTVLKPIIEGLGFHSVRFEFK